jgi:hypothetical protein
MNVILICYDCTLYIFKYVLRIIILVILNLEYWEDIGGKYAWNVLWSE